MELTIPGAVASAAREFGDAPALAGAAFAGAAFAGAALADAALADPGPDGLRLSYRELGERVTAVAAALVAAGVAPSDRVAIWAPNDCYWVLAALGALSAGGVLVPVSTRFTGHEALDVISRSGSRALFVAGDFLGVDRLAALRAAADAADVSLDRLGLVVRVPEDWAAFERRSASVPSCTGRRCTGRRCTGRRCTGRRCTGRRRAGWAGRLPAELPRAGRAGDRGDGRAHRGGRGAFGPGGHLGAQRLLLGAGRAGRAQRGRCPGPGQHAVRRAPRRWT